MIAFFIYDEKKKNVIDLLKYSKEKQLNLLIFSHFFLIKLLYAK